MDTWTNTLLIGVGATALTDLWALARRRLLHVPPPDYALVGRWIAHMRHGRFRHAAIAAAAPVRHERAIGWTAHYLVGIGFAALLPLAFGTGWLRQPALWPAIAIGIGTVAAPFLLMQPGMGAGVAASRTSRPARARMHSLLTHLVFGFGLYASALLLAQLTAR